jgi:hypothetical protein
MLTITRALGQLRRASASAPIPSDLSRLLITPLPTDALPGESEDQPELALGQLRVQLSSGVALRDLLATDSQWHEAVDEEVLALPATCVVGAN